jgi:predicted RNA-binding protein with TRAM domain
MVNYLERDFNRNRDRRGPRNFERRPETPKPFKIGDVIDLTIESIGEKGDGVGKVNGFVVFVKDVKEGDTVKVRITNIMRKFAVGEKTDGSAPIDEEPEDDESEEEMDDEETDEEEEVEEELE